MVRREIKIETLGQKIVGAIKKPFAFIGQNRRANASAILSVTSPHTITRQPLAERRMVQKALRVLGKNSKEVQNWYEGGFPFLDGTRSWVPSIIQDARYDQNMVTRRELMRRMRYWAQNSGLCKSTQDTRRQYVIGTHAPVVTCLSQNADWAELAEKVYEEMNEHSGLDGESFYTQLSTACDVEGTDGDVLFVETSVKMPITIRAGTKYETVLLKSVPRYQLIEGHRIETPSRLWDREGTDIIDGVQFEFREEKLPNGEARQVRVRTGYWVKDSLGDMTAQESYAFIPVEKSVLIYSPHRVNQIRGLSRYYAGETTLALLEDLQKLEMRAQEIQSDLTVFITNGAGQIVDAKTQATLGSMNIKLSAGADGKPIVTTKDIENVKKIYQEINGGKQFVGRTGDTLNFLAPNRPSEATQNLWEYLINIWCAAAKAPRILVFPKAAKGQGTEVRAELDKANSGFIADFNQEWKPLLKQSWKFKIGWAINNDERLKNAPADWEAIEVSPPRSVMVDLGYDSAAQLAELAAGVTNLHFVAQRLGTTAKRLIKLAINDIYQLKKQCLIISGQYTAGMNIEVKPEEVRQSLGDVVKNLAAMKTAQAQTTAAEATANS